MATPDDESRKRRLAANKQLIEHAIQEAVNEAILLHQHLGLPIVEWQDGKIAHVPPEQLADDEPKPTH